MRRYLCDPAKNTECKKTSCQTDCFITYKSECKADGEESKLFDLLEELAEIIPDYEEGQWYVPNGCHNKNITVHGWKMPPSWEEEVSI